MEDTGCTEEDYQYLDKELEKCVNSELEHFEFDNYYYEAYYKTIRKIVQNVIRYDLKLKEAYKIPIYQNEYDIIKSCGDNKHQKLLITLYVMARWNGNEFGWTSSKSKTPHIKKSANLNVSNKDCFMTCQLMGILKALRKLESFVIKC